jgi:hypothetical protein
MSINDHECPKLAALELQLLELLLDCNRERLNQQLDDCRACGQCDRRARDVLGDFFHALITEREPKPKARAASGTVK